MTNEEIVFIEEARQTKSWSEVAKEYSVKYSEITGEALRSKYRREIRKLDNTVGEGLIAKAIRVIQREPITSTNLARKLELNWDQLDELVNELQESRAAIKWKDNYLVWDKLAGKPENKTTNVSFETDGGWLRFGLLSDTHGCSIYEIPEAVNELYNIYESEGVNCVFHTGDLSDGIGNVFKGQLSELKIFGVDKQLDYLDYTYPEKPFKTYILSGNHDWDSYKTCGIDMIKNLCGRRDDFEYVGQYGAFVKANDVSFYLLHGDGGIPVAISYKPQKIIDTFKIMPDVTIMGHWHTFLHLPKYRGTICILPGCTQRQTEYMRRKSLHPNIGGVILSAKIAEINGVNKVIKHYAEFIDLEHLA